MQDQQQPGVPEQHGRLKAAHALSDLVNTWSRCVRTCLPETGDAAVNNALVGTPEQVAEQMQERFDPEDRLMLWFDFNNHNEKRKFDMKYK